MAGLSDVKSFPRRNNDAQQVRLEAGWYAISANLIAGYQCGFYDTHVIDAFRRLDPNKMVGYSFLLYCLDPIETNGVAGN
jgi:hypothetical protein